MKIKKQIYTSPQDAEQYERVVVYYPEGAGKYKSSKGFFRIETLDGENVSDYFDRDVALDYAENPEKMLGVELYGATSTKRKNQLYVLGDMDDALWLTQHLPGRYKASYEVSPADDKTFAQLSSKDYIKVSADAALIPDNLNDTPNMMSKTVKVPRKNKELVKAISTLLSMYMVMQPERHTYTERDDVTEYEETANPIFLIGRREVVYMIEERAEKENIDVSIKYVTAMAETDQILKNYIKDRGIEEQYGNFEIVDFAEHINVTPLFVQFAAHPEITDDNQAAIFAALKIIEDVLVETAERFKEFSSRTAVSDYAKVKTKLRNEDPRLVRINLFSASDKNGGDDMIARLTQETDTYKTLVTKHETDEHLNDLLNDLNNIVAILDDGSIIIYLEENHPYVKDALARAGVATKEKLDISDLSDEERETISAAISNEMNVIRKERQGRKATRDLYKEKAIIYIASLDTGTALAIRDALPKFKKALTDASEIIDMDLDAPARIYDCDVVMLTESDMQTISSGKTRMVNIAIVDIGNTAGINEEVEVPFIYDDHPEINEKVADMIELAGSKMTSVKKVVSKNVKYIMLELSKPQIDDEAQRESIVKDLVYTLVYG